MIKIDHQRWYERPLKTRIPFRYGIAVMNAVPHVWLELTAVIDGRAALGYAADHLPPKWFTKDPARPVDDEIEEMREVLRQATRSAVNLSAEAPFALIREVYHRQDQWAREHQVPPLLANFGPSLVERAVLDAFCRHHACGIREGLARPDFGLRLADLHPSLEESNLSVYLPNEPLGSITCRHTVGLGDPLEPADQLEGTVPDDPLPVDLATVIRTYGMTQFKIKVTDGDAGIERLERVVSVIETATAGNFAASLDGNETFPSVARFQDFWARAQERASLRSLWPRVLFVEQPFARSIALEASITSELKAWSNRPALIIDESGSGPEDLRRALAGGYVGVSHKNCKGVLHGLGDACLLAQYRWLRPEGRFLMTGEDLSNVGPIALPQDLAVQALLGNESVERNGHHYFAGLSAWPKEVQTHVLAVYPSLFRASTGGWPTLRVEAGQVDVREVNRQAFGGPLLPTSALALSAPWFEC